VANKVEMSENKQSLQS